MNDLKLSYDEVYAMTWNAYNATLNGELSVEWKERILALCSDLMEMHHRIAALQKQGDSDGTVDAYVVAPMPDEE